MVYRKISNALFEVSAICLGGVALSAPGDRAGIYRLLDRYLEFGGNMIDTANVYGKWYPGGQGTSEQNIGAWLRDRKTRQRVLLSTKGGHPELATMAKSRLAKADVAHDLDESLKNLGTDLIDLYWLHRDDSQRPAGEMLEYLEEFVQAGKIRAYGCSNWQPARIEEAASYAAQHKLTGFCANQLMWSLAKPNPDALSDLVAMDDASLALHVRHRLPAFAYMSLANGLFSKMADPAGGELEGRLRTLYENETNHQRFARARKLALKLNLSPTAVSVAYLINQKDFTTIPIAGCRTVDQLDDIMAAAQVKLEAATLQELMA
jgi:aryl-alcohol dehydrogenase-like predicted oxidoreductase